MVGAVNLLILLVLISEIDCYHNKQYKIFEREANYVFPHLQLLNVQTKNQCFLSGGLSELFWANVRTLNVSAKISNSCRRDLKLIDESLKIGNHEIQKCEYKQRGTLLIPNSLPTKVLDSSSSMPSGFLEGTKTNFGDFDQCLGTISSKSGEKQIFGQYCDFNLYPLDPNKELVNNDKQVSSQEMGLALCALASRVVTRGELEIFDDYCDTSKEESNSNQQVSLEDTGFKGVSLSLALCVPSSCTFRDINSIVAERLQSYPIAFHGDGTCETREGNRFSSRFKESHIAQQLSV